MNIQVVHSREQLKLFLGLPYVLYKNDPVWVPPLLDELKGQFDPRRNPTLDHLEYQLFLLYEEKQLIGRIAAFIDKIMLDFWKESIGSIGDVPCSVFRVPK